ncbi:uncharacterized protein BT62DRAFT_931521 [Guyanagaster necrorhizus]|uniref:Carbohydrate-binding module family 19 domain-containing protein n=1 Tax=Guyanagaster necrorhizus TaxID=856835 RepID=A0A9P8ATF8_9AGAR|nr:uncharacterized protein BT62DRAFT_931521 [Guyanagaster necrorhizus MCA 3950]KAG7446946.1 hypothetical protein BT62DRAFT_931521 [Guyanagaster necrorhizus MCA 3950]
MFSSVLFATSFFLSVHAAPTASLNASALLANGQAAQSQNVAFQNLSVNDTCSTGEVACISSDVAQCGDNSQWTTSPCSGSAQCFVLPSVRENGTFIQCASEIDAASIINATGTTGGIFGTDTDTSNSTTSSTNSTTSSANSTDTTSGTDSGSGIVTVTITLTPTATVFVSTEVPVTTTLSPDEASSLLASLTGMGASVVTDVSATDAEVAESSSAATTISLVPASAATSSS